MTILHITHLQSTLNKLRSDYLFYRIIKQKPIAYPVIAYMRKPITFACLCVASAVDAKNGLCRTILCAYERRDNHIREAEHHNHTRAHTTTWAKVDAHAKLEYV